MKFGKKFQEFVYSLSTNDKYADYDSRKSFNRINKPKTETETNLLSHSNDSAHDYEEDSNFEKHKDDGVHETRLAWRHIKNWLDKYSADLSSSLQKACTCDDLNDFQKDLNTKLPNCVLEFYKITDGQLSDDYNKVGGLFFGLKLMPLDEILVMTQNWRKVAKKLTTEMSQLNNSTKLRTLPKMNNYRSSNSSIDLVNVNDANASNTSLHSIEEQNASKYPRQRAIPPGTIHPIFAHPQWIPLITDEVGNCVGVDLSPPVTRNDNFGDFLLIFANDLEIGNWDIKVPEKNNYGDLMMGSEGDLVYVDKETKQEVGYLTVLKRRCISKWINSLDKEEADPSVRKLIEELKLNPDSILNVKNVNDNSIDDFINKNLNLIADTTIPVEEDIAQDIIPKRSKSGKKIEKKSQKAPSVPTKVNEPTFSDSGGFVYSEGKTLEDVEL